ncbi:MAG: ABC transporter ATP-binding protein [Bacillota bacterium]
MKTIVTLNHVAKRYAGKSPWALKDISLSVDAGQVYGLVGENGAGKTTLIKILLGLIRPNNGEVILPKDLRIAYVPDKPAFYNTMTAGKYLALAARMQGLKGYRVKQEVNNVLETVDLHHKAGEAIATFSKGMMQRLGIAQALLGEPDFIIMDEPASGLDPFGQKEIRDVIQVLKGRGKTVLFSSHYLSDIQRVCTRIGVLHQGQLLLDQPMDEIVLRGRNKVEIEVDANADLAAEILSGNGLSFDRSGPKFTLYNLDDAGYFAVMRQFNESRIRVLELKYPGLLLEDLYISLAASPGGVV